jgi:ribosome-associated translation inhibitor RaiA
MNVPDPLRHLIDVKVTRLRDAVDQVEQVVARLPAARRKHVAPAVEALGLAVDEIERRIHR